jgi:hypothetical protein
MDARSLPGDIQMNYQIRGLSPEPFFGLYGLSDGALAERQARRYRANARPGFPDRIEIRDVDPGNDVLLVNYVYQAGSTPYRASHAVFVREGAERTALFLNEVPEALKVRSLSVRAFDSDHWMVDADLCEGRELDGLVRGLLANDTVDYLQVHFAKRGCYAARVERA